MPETETKIVRLDDRVTAVEKEMSTLREHIDERLDSGKVRMNELAEDVKDLKTSLSDIAHAMTHTQRDLQKHMEVEETQRQTLLESLKVIQTSAEKTSAFFSDVGKIDPTELRANHDWAIKTRGYGNRAMQVLIGLGVVGLIGFILKSGGTNVGP